MNEEWKEFEAESRRASRRLVWIGTTVVIGVLAAFWYFDGSAVQEQQAAEETVLATPRSERNDTTVVQPQPEPPQPVAGPSVPGVSSPGGRQTVVGVYECIVNGQRVLSDVACGPDAQVRAVVVDRPDPRDVVQAQQRTQAVQAETPQATYRSASTSTVGTAPAEPPQASNASECARVDQQIAALNAQMRQGYTSQQGEWLHERWRKLQKRRAELKCGR